MLFKFNLKKYVLYYNMSLNNKENEFLDIENLHYLEKKVGKTFSS